MFSKACEYGIRAVLFISRESLKGNRVGLKQITQEIDSPEAFTAKILQILSRNQIINSVKGPHGGFEVEEGRLDKVKLSEIVDAIDGDSIYNGCGLGLKKCNAKKPCPLHYQFAAIRNELKEMLESTTLRELATSLTIGETVLKR